MADLDQHFTDAREADRLVASLMDRLDPARQRHYLEPACGKGAFLDALQHAGVSRSQIRTVEIDPALTADVCGDFLASSRESLGIQSWSPAMTMIVGNPPFGHNGQQARAFLNKAANYAHWVCFVLPRSMHGAHCCGSVNSRLELIYERFLTGGFTTTKAKCNWQEWFLLPEGCLGRRPTARSADPQGLYSLVTVRDDHQIIIQRCGGTVGKVTVCNGSGQGKYYIRSPYPEVLHAFGNLGKHEEADLTTHQCSLSARMLHDLLERQLLKQYVQQIKGVA